MAVDKDYLKSMEIFISGIEADIDRCKQDITYFKKMIKLNKKEIKHERVRLQKAFEDVERHKAEEAE